MRRRPELRIAPAVLAVAALVACGRGDSQPSPAQSVDATPGVPAPESPAPPPPAESPAFPTAEGGAAADADPVLAEVNGRPIRAKRVLGAVEMNRMRARSMGHTLSSEEEAGLREAALNAFVADELLFQAAQAEGIVPSDPQVVEEVASLRSGFATAEEYQAFLSQAGMTEAGVRGDAARRLTVRAYVKKIVGDTAVPESEARAFYDAHQREFEVPEQVRASIIVVLSKSGDAEPLRAEARQRIEEAHGRAVAGEDFAALARQYSQVLNAADGGDLGPFGRGDGLFPKIEDMAFSTPPGQVSPVFETPSGLCVVKTFERIAPRVRPFEEVKPVLIEELGRQKEGAAVEAKVQELQQQAAIEMKAPSFLSPPLAPPPAR